MGDKKLAEGDQSQGSERGVLNDIMTNLRGKVLICTKVSDKRERYIHFCKAVKGKKKKTPHHNESRKVYTNTKKTGGFEKREKVDRGKGQMKLDWNGLNVTLLLLSSIVPFSLLPKKKKQNRILKK